MKHAIWLPFLFAALAFMSGCQSVPKQTVELAEVSDYQITELQKSHIKFIKLYYEQRRIEVNNFLQQKWIPKFLGKAVRNDKFLKSLRTSYRVSDISVDDLKVNIKAADGSNLNDDQLKIIETGIQDSVEAQRAKLGQTLIYFAEATQAQIDRQRDKLLEPLNAQEQLVVEQVNAAFADLLRSNASLRGYLASAVNLKQKQDEALEKLGLLEKTNKALNTVYSANEKISSAMKEEKIVNVKVTHGGSGYDDANPPAVTLNGGTGRGFSATATVSGGVVTKIVLDDPGGYTAQPTGVTIAAPPAVATNPVTATASLSWFSIDDLSNDLKNALTKAKKAFGD